MFTAQETAACRRLIEWALKEDLGEVGDLTSEATIPNNAVGQAAFVPRHVGILAGLEVVAEVLAAVDDRLRLKSFRDDGDAVQANEPFAQVSGPVRSLLAAERTALNFLQRLSGVATLTRRYVDAVAGLPCQILDTRKTTPGWRFLEKYAVRCGGGKNHRVGLYDGILIKDNHLAALPRESGKIAGAIRVARERAGPGIFVQVEVDNLQQLDEALVACPDAVLLDNLSLADLAEAVRRRNERAPNVLLEASGGITLATVRDVAKTGVDRISVGALTHSAPALDVGLDYLFG